jgi:hypothetical protein
LPEYHDEVNFQPYADWFNEIATYNLTTNGNFLCVLDIDSAFQMSSGSSPNFSTSVLDVCDERTALPSIFAKSQLVFPLLGVARA